MKVLLLHSSSTKGGTRRIGELLGNEIGWDQKRDWPSNAEAYDGIILHNRLDARPQLPCAIYPCGMPTARIVHDAGLGADLTRRKVKVIWANSHTAAAMLGKNLALHVPCRYMPKPFPFTIPDELVDAPEPGSEAAKTILWYWKPDWHYTKDLTSVIVKLINELSDFNIRLINNSTNPKVNAMMPPGVGSHVTTAGRINVPAKHDEFVGMVRVTAGLDFGRITYQLQAYGKWVIYVGMKEPGVTCTKRFTDVPRLVRELCSGVWDDYKRTKAWEYIASGFTEEGLHKMWVEEVKRVFK